MARDFNGTTQFFGNASDMGLTQFPFFVSCWFRLTSIPTTTAYIWAVSHSTNVRFHGLFINGTSADKQLFGTAYDGVTQNGPNSGTFSWQTGVWYWAGYECLNSFTRRLYFNNQTFTNGSNINIATYDRFTIGGYNFGAGINAQVAEVYICATQLTAGEITSMRLGFSGKLVRQQLIRPGIEYLPLAGSATDEYGIRGTVFTNNGSSPVVSTHPQRYDV